jgi:hypothetical protein
MYGIGLVLLLLTACGNDKPVPTETTTSFPIEKLTGKWEDISKENAFYEEWRIADKDSLIGKGYVLIQQDTVFIENLRMWKENGICKFAALISNQKKGEQIIFEQTGAQNGRIIFENRQHDFPQRIIYELISNVEMHVLIDGQQNGDYHKQHFSFIRK